MFINVTATIEISTLAVPKGLSTKYKTVKAFLEYVVPTAQIVTDPRHGLVVLPEGVSPGQGLPDTCFAAPLIDADPELTETVANETRRIVGEFSGPASLAEVSGRLSWALGQDAERTWTKYKTFRAFLACAVPTAQILTDQPPGWVYPEGVPLDHPRPDSWFAAPGDYDDEALTEIVADETRRIVGALARAATFTEVSTGLIRSLGPDAKRAWARPKNLKAFLAEAVPSAQIVTDPKQPLPMKMIGHVTSSYWSEALGRSVAMALVEDGRARIDQSLYIPMPGQDITVKVVTPIFYDPQGERLKV